MAGPQSFTPRSVRPSTPKKRYLLDQANKTLPLVKRIVGDIVRVHEEALHLQERAESLREGVEHQKAQSELDLAMDHLKAYVAELHEMGVEVKDYQAGLVDFIGRHQGRDVNLCWKLGEDKIDFWHEVSTGFAGRKPVSTLEEQE